MYLIYLNVIYLWVFIYYIIYQINTKHIYIVQCIQPHYKITMMIWVIYMNFLFWTEQSIFTVCVNSRVYDCKNAHKAFHITFYVILNIQLISYIKQVIFFWRTFCFSNNRKYIYIFLVRVQEEFVFISISLSNIFFNVFNYFFLIFLILNINLLL